MESTINSLLLSKEITHSEISSIKMNKKDIMNLLNFNIPKKNNTPKKVLSENKKKIKVIK